MQPAVPSIQFYGAPTAREAAVSPCVLRETLLYSLFILIAEGVQPLAMLSDAEKDLFGAR